MFLYVIGPVDGPHKIGITNSLRKRLTAFNGASPTRNYIHGFVHILSRAAAEQAERAAHENLSAHRLNGEWFDCTLEAALETLAAHGAVERQLAQPTTISPFRAWRRRLGFSQIEAAKALGLSESRIMDYEKGVTRGHERPAPVPRHVALACAAIENKLEPVDFSH